MTEGDRTKDLAGLLGRLVVGGLFVYAGALKAAAPAEEFARAIESYRVIGPVPALLAACVVPWVEICAGALLAAGLFTRYSGLFTAAMLFFFEVLLGQAWLRNLPVTHCGCFGAQGSSSLPREFAQNLVLLGLLWPGLKLGGRLTADAVRARHPSRKFAWAAVLAVCLPALALPFLMAPGGARKAELPPAVVNHEPAPPAARKGAPAKPRVKNAQARSQATGLFEVNPGYGQGRDAARDIKTALALARGENKRVLVKVGGYWCEWCRRLDRFIGENGALAAYLGDNFVIVNVYYDFSGVLPPAIAGYPKPAGSPHIYILGPDGAVLESKDTVPLEAGSGYDLEKFMAFLAQWGRKSR
ncbi:MAG: hypothetical protein A2016_00615 [Elusimicrobia bacterium GWF2_62_30]|nr:MAG: hypothetical protein A2016_00615 [Elusimicrobia bacterium GWF2_62_30]